MAIPRSTSRITRTLAVLAWSVCTLLATKTALATPAAAAPPVKAVIDASRTSAPIHPNLYGMFIEHVGSLVYRGLWAELLDDRKFFNPVAPETRRRAAGRAGARSARPPRRWTPIGPAERVTMDAHAPTSATTRPRSRSTPSEPRGIAQKGLALLRDKSYTGRIVLAGDPAARVSVSLVWGAGATDRETVTIGTLSAAYATFPLAFSARSTATTAGSRSPAPAQGAFRIGAVSLMPADNVEGFAARGRRGAEAAAVGRLSLPGRQLRLRSRLARRDRRARPTPAGLGPGLECGAVERCRHRRVHDAVPAVERRAVYHGQRRLRRRLVGRASTSSTRTGPRRRPGARCAPPTAIRSPIA